MPTTKLFKPRAEAGGIPESVPSGAIASHAGPDVFENVNPSISQSAALEASDPVMGDPAGRSVLVVGAERK
jgi:hypothetical protein